MEYVKFILLIAAIFSEILFLLRCFRFEQNIAPLAVILFNTLVLYLFALINLLTVGFYFCTIISILCLLYLVFSKQLFVRKNEDSIFTFLPIICFAVLFIGAYLYTRGTLFWSWDEYSYWGVIYKYLMVVQKLPINTDTVVVTYPPFSALFQYLVSMSIANKEENALFAQIIIQFAAIFAFFPSPKRKSVILYALFLVVVSLSGFWFGYVFSTLYVDLLMGLLFAAGLSQLPFGGKQTLPQYLVIVGTASSIAILKPMGIILSCVLILAELVYLIKIKDIKFRSIRKLVSNWQLLFLLILPIGMWALWSFHTRGFSSTRMNLTLTSKPSSSLEIYPWFPAKYIDALKSKERDERIATLKGNAVEKTYSVQEILRAFTVNTSYKNKVIASQFVIAFSEGVEGSKFPSPKYFLVGIILLGIIVYNLRKRYSNSEEGNYTTFSLILIFGVLIYCVALYLAYIFFFGVDGLNIPSLSRYLTSYLIAWWIFYLVALYRLKNEIHVVTLSKISHSIAIFITLGLFLLIPTYNYLHLPPSPLPSRFIANNIYKRILQVQLSPQDKVYEVYYGLEYDYGLRHFMMRYFLTPIASNFTEWNIRSEVGTEDYSTIILSPSEWLNLLNTQGYTYVLVSNSDALFWKQYGELFNKHLNTFDSPQLFKVTKEGLFFIPLEL